MNTKPLRYLAAAIMLLPALALGANETDSGGLYGAVSGLYVSPMESELSASGGGVTLDLDMETKSGFGILGVVGYGVETGIRAELELSYRTADLDNILGIKYKGNVDSLSLMTNAVYILDHKKVRPYIGAGVGFVRQGISQDRQSFEGLHLPELSDEDTVFGYQGMLGVLLPMGNTEIRFGYRYFATTSAEFHTDYEEGSDGVKYSYATNNLEVGVVYRF